MSTAETENYTDEQRRERLAKIFEKMNDKDYRLSADEYSLLMRHAPDESDKATAPTDQFGIVRKETVHGGMSERFLVPIRDPLNPMEQFTKTEDEVIEMIGKALESNGLKIAQKIDINFQKKSGDEVIRRNAYFRSGPEVVTNSSQVGPAFRDTAARIMNTIDKWESEGSGWTIVGVTEHEIITYVYNPTPTTDQRMRGLKDIGSSYIELPKELRNTKMGLVNMTNKKDDKCFLWSHVRFLSKPEHHPERITKSDREFAKTLDYTGIEFPVELASIPRIEVQNNIRINIFGYEEGKFFPLYIGDAFAEDVMNLLLITNGKGNSHYVFIRNLSALFYSITKHKAAKHLCYYCISSFTTKEILRKHLELCPKINGVQAVSYPKPGSTISFKSGHKKLMVPFMIYADFEAIIVPSGEWITEKTRIMNVHKCCGFAYKVVCSYDENLSKSVVTYRGKDAAYKFLEAMISEERSCKFAIKKFFHEPFKEVIGDKREFIQQKVCHICDKELGDDKVADHCHYSGKFRGAAHRKCNLTYRFPKKIPVVFHNLRGYDAHFLTPEFGKFKRTPKPIASTMESYKCIAWGDISFIDSFQFMSSSLDRLASFLPKDSFLYTDREFREVYGKDADELLKLAKRKGVYPYDYFDSFDRFSETSLPTRDDFFNNLTGKEVSDEDYEHATSVWEAFKMKTLGDYHDLYLTTDVLILTDVFEKFRKTCMSVYKLDPAHYVSAPGLSWDAMLMLTGISLELISDPDIYQMVEWGMRGGVSFISKRFGAANNEKVPGYDPSKPKTWAIYLDANNLYGTAMSEPLPTGGFRFLTDDELTNFKLDDTPDGKGYFLEVDLTIPEELHNLMSDYPVAPEKRVVSDEMLSDYCKTAKETLGCTNNQEKLMATLYPKYKYVLHYRNLIYYLELGVKLAKIHRVIEFDESPFLKEYIALNTERRQLATNNFEKGFYKLMNNAIYGKTCENLRKRKSLDLVTDPKIFRKMINRPNFVDSKIFSEDLVVVQRTKLRLTLNKPIYVGCAVLDLSKLHMYKFHYGEMMEKYGPDRARLLFTDTDSLTYLVETENIYDDMFSNKQLFDFSNYPEDSPYFWTGNKAVLGKMKDECEGSFIHEFVGLRAKMYALEIFGPDGKRKVIKKAKGVKKSVVGGEIEFSDFKDSLFKKIRFSHKQKGFSSKGHKIITYEVNKSSINYFDNKVFILPDGVNTVPYGHKLTGLSDVKYTPKIRNRPNGKAFRIVKPYLGLDD